MVAKMTDSLSKGELSKLKESDLYELEELGQKPEQFEHRMCNA